MATLALHLQPFEDLYHYSHTHNQHSQIASYYGYVCKPLECQYSGMFYRIQFHLRQHIQELCLHDHHYNYCYHLNSQWFAVLRSKRPFVFEGQQILQEHRSHWVEGWWEHKLILWHITIPEVTNKTKTSFQQQLPIDAINFWNSSQICVWLEIAIASFFLKPCDIDSIYVCSSADLIYKILSHKSRGGTVNFFNPISELIFQPLLNVNDWLKIAGRSKLQMTIMKTISGSGQL